MALEYGTLGETSMKALALAVGLLFILVNFSLLRGDDLQVDPDKLPPPAAGTMDFARDIKPILERSCLRCHSDPRIVRNQAPNKGGLNLESREAALQGGATGVVIIPGKSATSPLIHLVSGFPVGDVRAMPPREGARLSKEEIGKLRAWIDQGAVWAK
jgi:hypothetical protein